MGAAGKFKAKVAKATKGKKGAAKGKITRQLKKASNAGFVKRELGKFKGD